MKMHKTLFLNWLGALVLALLMPASASTQQPNTPAYQRARATLPPDQAAAFDEILTRARARGLPTSPLIDKALEGAAKGAAPYRVIEVVRQRADQLGRARDIIGARSSNEVVTVALALDRGVDQGVARRVAAGARPHRFERTAVAVVQLPLRRIIQHFEGLLQLLELGLGRLVVGVHVGVIFAGQLAIGLLNIRRRSVASYAQYLIVVFCHP